MYSDRVNTYELQTCSKSKISVIPVRITSCIEKCKASLLRRPHCLCKINLQRNIPACSKPFSVTFLNCHSICNKTDSLHHYIESNRFDIFAIAETWTFEEGDEATIAEILPKGYKHLHVPRPNVVERGGGIIIVYKEGLDLRRLDSTERGNYTQFEYIDCILRFQSQQIRFVIVYRPSPSKKNGLKLSKFWKEWTKFLGKLLTHSYEIIIYGDLNFHLDIKEESGTRRFNSILEEFGLTQHVREPTHVKKHTLDILITNETSSLICNLQVTDPALCNKQGNILKDHFAISTLLNIANIYKANKTIQYRDFKNLDYDRLKMDLAGSLLLNRDHTETLTVEELSSLYNSTLRHLLDKYAPLKTKKVVEGKNSPWFKKENRMQKRLLRRKERLYRKTKLAVHREAYHQQSAIFFKDLKKSRTQYCSNKVKECGSDQKKIFKLANSLLGRKSAHIVPKAVSDQALANDFMKYFMEKTKKIHEDLKLTIKREPDNYSSLAMQSSSIPPQLQAFAATTESEVKKIVTESVSKQCPLDPIPTWLLKILLDLLLPVIVSIINKSLQQAEVPVQLKTALLRPLLKDHELEWNSHSSYRPVSNLPYVSKLLEKVVHARIENHLTENNLNDPDQTAYSKYNSTETALLSIQNDILDNMDNQKATILVMLDISAAYDTIDHDIFLARLKTDCGINGKALRWMESYLRNRKNQVIIGSKRSFISTPKCGTPQGSVMGGKCYNMYAAPLGKIAHDPGVQKKAYADDNNLYVAFALESVDDKLAAVSLLEQCLENIGCWMKNNLLKLNDDKTKVIVFAPKKFDGKYTDLCVTFNEWIIKPKPLVKILGVLFDSTMTLEKHINKKTKSAYFQIRNIWTIRPYLTENATRSLVNALVMPKLDYCNSLLAGLPQYLIRKLQRSQNAAARLIKRRSKRSRITPVLKELHWLPVLYRIKFKILLVTYKALNGAAPSYIYKLLPEFKTLRSDHLKFQLSKFNFKKLGGRAFKNIAPELWNGLPLHIRISETVVIFKKQLKTFYFKQHFGNDQEEVGE